MDIEQLRTLTDLKVKHSQQALSELQARENVLRNELERLRNLTRETQAQPPQQEQMRAIGGDVIWLQWLGRTQKTLNMELAQVLAQKEGLMAQHRHANGRKMAADQLALQEADKRRRAKLQAQLDAAIDHSLQR